ncbi:uncharacterized protein LOC143589014 [Bidens hawaiensis]|uniref:uncharacterized protein LOC143589014 n=1 Tax=Bidens hawaiensis TaxID=980011 RepID=UPI0040498602
MLKRIFDEIGDDVFVLLVDESSDVFGKEQMAIVLRYVNTHGLIKERFVRLVHAMETSSSVLKSSIDIHFAKHNLSSSRLRRQGITNTLSRGLQKKDQEMSEAVSMVESTKAVLQNFRECGFDKVLAKLALVLPVATASVERSFSSMKRIKSSLRNRISDDFLNACVICAVEVDELVNVTNEDVIERFQKMKTR